MSAPPALSRALASADVAPHLSGPLHIIAAGKAASAMAAAISARPELHIARTLAIGTHRDPAMPASVEWHESAHPLPDMRSVAAGRRALAVAAEVPPDACLVLLLSGGASALMAVPLDGIALEDKQHAVRTMMLAGADIHALNTVRKHLSAVKGGRLAAACRGRTVTLAISDVIGDDLSVIGSGPGVPDPSTWADARDAIEQYGGADHRPSVRAAIARGVRQEIAETPKPGDASLARAHAYVIASRRHALAAARAAAEARGYRPILLDGEVAGEARLAAPEWLSRAAAAARGERACVLSAGETTVRVTGRGRGGRNQEFVLALVDRLASATSDVMVASVGTDGIDGPTDAAGALADRQSHARAASLMLDPRACLDDNDAYHFFAPLGDLIHLGRTDTNVGDIQVFLT